MPFPRHIGTLPSALIALVLTAALPPRLAAQSVEGLAVVVGETSAWMIEAPEGWDLEAAGAKAAGLGAAFIPEGTTWSTAPSVLYGITIPKSSPSGSIETIMQEDSIRTERRQPGTIVEKADPIGTIEGVDARVRYCYAPDSSTIEAVAYLDGPTAVAVIVLNTRSIESFHASLAAFARLVDSWEWITSDPTEIARIRGEG